MKRKLLAMTMTGMLVIGMLAGCGGKDPETTVNTEVSTQKEVTSNEVAAEKSVTMIQNTANELSAVIGEIQTATNHSFEKMVLTYQNESVTITEKSISDHKTNKKLTVTKTEKKKEFFNAQGVPQVSLTFKEVTKSAQPLKIEITWKDKEGAETTKSATVNIHVVPESMKVVKQLTENQKISEKVKKYDFDVYAKNITDSVKDATATAKVKSSNVKFGTPGHYEVVYEVTVTPTPVPNTEPKPETGDIPVDVEIVDKDHADKDDVIMENVKPGQKPEEINPSEDKKPEEGKPSEDTEKSNKDVTDNGNTGSNGGNTSSGNGNSSGGNSASNGGNNNGSSGGNTSSKPSHTHNWVAHTATKQVWVPNIVVVDDYETQNVLVRTDIICNCGAVFTGGAGYDEHAMNHVLAGEPSNSTPKAIYKQQSVKVGSHEEDHGYYKDETYTDYTYCSDCGARQ